MALVNAILLVEIFCRVTNSKTLFKAMTAINIYCIVYDLYTSLFTVSYFAFCFVLLANSPYLLALLKLSMRSNSTHRRRFFHKVCKNLILISVFMDLWISYTLNPNDKEMCQAVVYSNPSVISMIMEKYPELTEYQAE
jgi:hypothetical protein